MKNWILTAIGFMAATLVALTAQGTYQDMVAFVASCGAFGFLIHMDRKNHAEIDALKAEFAELQKSVKDCVQQVNSIAVAINWNKT